MWARRRNTFFLLLRFSFLLCLAGGCRNCDLVEAELRSRENELRELRGNLTHAELENEALLREIAAVRQGTAAKMSPEQASQFYGVKQITLGRGTGGLDEDNVPGDEAIQVMIEPRDSDGHTIKAPGAVHVEALEISREGIKVPLDAWELSPEQVRKTWHSGLLSAGYSIVLPWKNWPSSEKLRVIIRFTLSDGRVFEADKDISIRITPTALHRAPGIIAPVDPHGPSLPPSLPMLPFPRKVEPEQSSTSTAWWLPPPDDPRALQPTAAWRPKAAPSLADSVQLLRPHELPYQPGEQP